MEAVLRDASLTLWASVAVLLSSFMSPASVLMSYAGLLNNSVPVHVDMRGRVVVVTGANTGIGKEVAAKLAMNGATVVLACRSMERANGARVDIERILDAATQDHEQQCQAGKREMIGDNFASEGKVLVRQLDVSDLDSVRAFAKSLLAEFPRLDVLVNNAGLASINNFPKGHKTKQGVEYVFGTNYVGHFLLTDLLLDRLKENKQGAKIVNLGSVMHHWSSKNLVHAALGQKWDNGYNDSKMAMILHARELNRRLHGTSVHAVATNPGFVASDIWRVLHGLPFLSQVWGVTTSLYALTVEQGALTTVYAATHKLPQSVQYLVPYWVPTGWWIPFEMMGPLAGARPCTPRLPADEEKVSRELWEATKKLCET